MTARAMALIFLCLGPFGFLSGAVDAADRTRDDTNTPEANAVVRIGGCTGTLITDRLVLSAAHCAPAGIPQPPPEQPLPCERLPQQRDLQISPAWQDPMQFHDISPNRRPLVRFGQNADAFGLGMRAEAYSLPYCADMVLLRLPHPVPAGVARPLPVLVGLGPDRSDLPWDQLQLRHSGWGEAKHDFNPEPVRRVGPVQPWTQNACHLFTLPPLRKDGARIVNGDSGSPLIAQDTRGREFVIGVIFGSGAPDQSTCGAPHLRVPARHGTYTPTWRGAVPGTDATALGVWIAHHAPSSALIWSELSPGAE
jgi:hypothetical protein